VTRYFLCDSLLDGSQLRKEIHALDGRAQCEAQYEALLSVEDTITHLLRWWTWNDARWSLVPAEIETIQPEFERAGDALLTTADASEREAIRRHEVRLVSAGLTPSLARRVTRTPLRARALAVLVASKEADAPVERAASVLQGLQQSLHLAQAARLLRAQQPVNSWEKRFAVILERVLAELETRLVARVLATSEGDDALEAFISLHSNSIEVFGNSLTELEREGHGALVPLFLLLDALKELVYAG
jgi:NAD-specific glutamate dehydrogenase